MVRDTHHTVSAADGGAGGGHQHNRQPDYNYSPSPPSPSTVASAQQQQQQRPLLFGVYSPRGGEEYGVKGGGAPSLNSPPPPSPPLSQKALLIRLLIVVVLVAVASVSVLHRTTTASSSSSRRSIIMGSDGKATAIVNHHGGDRTAAASSGSATTEEEEGEVKRREANSATLMEGGDDADDDDDDDDTYYYSGEEEGAEGGADAGTSPPSYSAAGAVRFRLRRQLKKKMLVGAGNNNTKNNGDAEEEKEASSSYPSPSSYSLINFTEYYHHHRKFKRRQQNDKNGTTIITDNTCMINSTPHPLLLLGGDSRTNDHEANVDDDVDEAMPLESLRLLLSNAVDKAAAMMKKKQKAAADNKHDPRGASPPPPSSFLRVEPRASIATINDYPSAPALAMLTELAAAAAARKSNTMDMGGGDNAMRVAKALAGEVECDFPNSSAAALMVASSMVNGDPLNNTNNNTKSRSSVYDVLVQHNWASYRFIDDDAVSIATSGGGSVGDDDDEGDEGSEDYEDISNESYETFVGRVLSCYRDKPRSPRGVSNYYRIIRNSTGTATADGDGHHGREMGSSSCVPLPTDLTGGGGRGRGSGYKSPSSSPSVAALPRYVPPPDVTVVPLLEGVRRMERRIITSPNNATDHYRHHHAPTTMATMGMYPFVVRHFPSIHSRWLFDDWRLWEGELRCDGIGNNEDDKSSSASKDKEVGESATIMKMNGGGAAIPPTAAALLPPNSPAAAAAPATSPSPLLPPPKPPQLSQFVTMGRLRTGGPDDNSSSFPPPPIPNLYTIDYYCVDEVDGSLVVFEEHHHADASDTADTANNNHNNVSNQQQRPKSRPPLAVKTPRRVDPLPAFDDFGGTVGAGVGFFGAANQRVVPLAAPPPPPPPSPFSAAGSSSPPSPSPSPSFLHVLPQWQRVVAHSLARYYYYRSSSTTTNNNDADDYSSSSFDAVKKTKRDSSFASATAAPSIMFVDGPSLIHPLNRFSNPSHMLHRVATHAGHKKLLNVTNVMFLQPFEVRPELLISHAKGRRSPSPRPNVKTEDLSADEQNDYRSGGIPTFLLTVAERRERDGGDDGNGAAKGQNNNHNHNNNNKKPLHYTDGPVTDVNIFPQIMAEDLRPVVFFRRKVFDQGTNQFTLETLSRLTATEDAMSGMYGPLLSSGAEGCEAYRCATTTTAAAAAAYGGPQTIDGVAAAAAENAMATRRRRTASATAAAGGADADDPPRAVAAVCSPSFIADHRRCSTPYIAVPYTPRGGSVRINVNKTIGTFSHRTRTPVRNVTRAIFGRRRLRRRLGGGDGSGGSSGERRGEKDRTETEGEDILEIDASYSLPYAADTLNYSRAVWFTAVTILHREAKAMRRDILTAQSLYASSSLVSSSSSSSSPSVAPLWLRVPLSSNYTPFVSHFDDDALQEGRATKRRRWQRQRRQEGGATINSSLPILVDATTTGDDSNAAVIAAAVVDAKDDDGMVSSDGGVEGFFSDAPRELVRSLLLYRRRSPTSSSPSLSSSSPPASPSYVYLLEWRRRLVAYLAVFKHRQRDRYRGRALDAYYMELFAALLEVGHLRANEEGREVGVEDEGEAEEGQWAVGGGGSPPAATSMRRQQQQRPPPTPPLLVCYRRGYVLSHFSPSPQKKLHSASVRGRFVDRSRSTCHTAEMLRALYASYWQRYGMCGGGGGGGKGGATVSTAETSASSSASQAPPNSLPSSVPSAAPSSTSAVDPTVDTNRDAHPVLVLPMTERRRLQRLFAASRRAVEGIIATHIRQPQPQPQQQQNLSEGARGAGAAANRSTSTTSSTSSPSSHQYPYQEGHDGDEEGGGEYDERILPLIARIDAAQRTYDKALMAYFSDGGGPLGIGRRLRVFIPHRSGKGRGHIHFRQLFTKLMAAGSGGGDGDSADGGGGLRDVFSVEVAEATPKDMAVLDDDVSFLEDEEEKDGEVAEKRANVSSSQPLSIGSDDGRSKGKGTFRSRHGQSGRGRGSGGRGSGGGIFDIPLRFSTPRARHHRAVLAADFMVGPHGADLHAMVALKPSAMAVEIAVNNRDVAVLLEDEVFSRGYFSPIGFGRNIGFLRVLGGALKVSSDPDDAHAAPGQQVLTTLPDMRQLYAVAVCSWLTTNAVRLADEEEAIAAAASVMRMRKMAGVNQSSKNNAHAAASAAAAEDYSFLVPWWCRGGPGAIVRSLRHYQVTSTSSTSSSAQAEGRGKAMRKGNTTTVNPPAPPTSSSSSSPSSSSTAPPPPPSIRSSSSNSNLYSLRRSSSAAASSLPPPTSPPPPPPPPPRIRVRQRHVEMAEAALTPSFYTRRGVPSGHSGFVVPYCPPLETSLVVVHRAESIARSRGRLGGGDRSLPPPSASSASESSSSSHRLRVGSTLPSHSQLVRLQTECARWVGSVVWASLPNPPSTAYGATLTAPATRVATTTTMMRGAADGRNTSSSSSSSSSSFSSSPSRNVVQTLSPFAAGRAPNCAKHATAIVGASLPIPILKGATVRGAVHVESLQTLLESVLFLRPLHAQRVALAMVEGMGRGRQQLFPPFPTAESVTNYTCGEYSLLNTEWDPDAEKNPSRLDGVRTCLEAMLHALLDPMRGCDGDGGDEGCWALGNRAAVPSSSSSSSTPTTSALPPPPRPPSPSPSPPSSSYHDLVSRRLIAHLNTIVPSSPSEGCGGCMRQGKEEGEDEDGSKHNISRRAYNSSSSYNGGHDGGGNAGGSNSTTSNATDKGSLSLADNSSSNSSSSDGRGSNSSTKGSNSPPHHGSHRHHRRRRRRSFCLSIRSSALRSQVASYIAREFLRGRVYAQGALRPRLVSDVYSYGTDCARLDG